MPEEMLDHALRYAARGWPVFKIAPGTKKPYPGSHGFLDAATNEIIVNRMWDDNPDADIAFATGATAGVWVLDIDGEEGSRNLTRLESKFGPLPETLEQRSASGGRHLFFRWPGGREVRNKQALKVDGVEHKGIDVRGEGGYIVLAPSRHPNGHTYSWPYGEDTPIADIPRVWLDAIAPIKQRVAPWKQPPAQVPPPRPAEPSGSSVLDRARRYLDECEPAVQGHGGHDKLLWAARAMVVGFQLDDATATSLLWDYYNPRCVPPWDMNSSSERKDFERKVSEARRTPGEKPSGWLLDEYGLRSEIETMHAKLAEGSAFARAMLAKPPTSADTPAEVAQWTGAMQEPFPVNHFPASIADYCRQVHEAHVVDPSFAGLPMLAVAGAAMGNVWRLELKKGFVVPPVLWVGVVAPSGTNKSGPVYEVMAPLKKDVPQDALENAMLNPQGEMCVSDATLEAVVELLGESKRGLLVFRDEFAGWVKSFNAYKNAGGDEQAWIEFWGAKTYSLHRKTNRERVQIPAAAVSVVGGLQPSVLAECFDPGRFASGFVPRILVTCPVPKHMYWSENEVGEDATVAWHEAIMWLRSRAFKGLDPNTGQYQPRMLRLGRDAKAEYVKFFNEMTDYIASTDNERAKLFASKARVQCARMILIHRGLVLASRQAIDEVDRPIGIESALAGVAWMRWCLNEQMQIYSFAASEHARSSAEYLVSLVRKLGGAVAVRDIQRMNHRRWKTAKDARESVDEAVNLGLLRWASPGKTVELINNGE